MDNKLSLLAAFGAGMLSFVSPCVLPLLSSYLFFITGVHPEGQLRREGEKKRLFSPGSLRIGVSTLFFILGFSLVFIVMSVLLYGFMVFLGIGNQIVTIAAGSLVMLLGFNVLFNFIPFLKYDDSGERCAACTPEHSVLSAKEGSFFHPSRRPGGGLGAFLVGVAFGAGWTPCVGVFLGSVLAMASQSETFGAALVYLAVYSGGLGVPFLITGLFWTQVVKRLTQFSKAQKGIQIISGILLILMGLMMALGRLTGLNAFFQTAGGFLSQWADSGRASVRAIPALIFLFLGLAPFLGSLLRKRPWKNRFCLVWGFLFFSLSAASVSGLLNCAAFISQWFSFSGM
jgi:cytochrome c-type biogenesis protein